MRNQLPPGARASLQHTLVSWEQLCVVSENNRPLCLWHKACRWLETSTSELPKVYVLTAMSQLPEWLVPLACWSWATGQPRRILEESRSPETTRTHAGDSWGLRKERGLIATKSAFVHVKWWYGIHIQITRVTLYTRFCLFFAFSLIYFRSQEFSFSNFL